MMTIGLFLCIRAGFLQVRFAIPGLTVNLLVSCPVFPLAPEGFIAKRQHKGHDEQQDTDQYQIVVSGELVNCVYEILKHCPALQKVSKIALQPELYLYLQNCTTFFPVFLTFHRIGVIMFLERDGKPLRGASPFNSTSCAEDTFNSSLEGRG